MFEQTGEVEPQKQHHGPPKLLEHSLWLYIVVSIAFVTNSIWVIQSH